LLKAIFLFGAEKRGGTDPVNKVEQFGVKMEHCYYMY